MQLHIKDNYAKCLSWIYKLNNSTFNRDLSIFILNFFLHPVSGRIPAYKVFYSTSWVSCLKEKTT